MLTAGTLLIDLLTLKQTEGETAMRKYQLRDQESEDQEKTGALDERPASRPCNEDESLADGADLKVYSRGKHFEVILSGLLKTFYMKDPLKIY